jgi:anthranilate synthase component 1
MGTTASASLDAIRSALASGQSALLWRKLIADTETPISAALKLMQPERGDFLLESVEGGAVRGRYSLLGLDPDLVFRAEGDSAEINRAWQTDRAAFAPLDGGALAGLRALVRNAARRWTPALPPRWPVSSAISAMRRSGWSKSCRVPAPNPLGLPDMLFVRPSVILMFDRLEDALFLVAPIWAGSVTQAERAIDAAQERIDATAARLASRCRPAPQIATPDDVTFTPVLPGRQISRHGARGAGLYRRGRHLSGGAGPALHRTLPAAAAQRSIARCGGSTPRPSSIASTCRALRSSAPARKSSCAHATAR